MINQDYPKNLASTNDAIYATSDHQLVAHEHKSVELKILQSMISKYEDSFSEKEKILEEEKQKLDELNYQIWSLKDSFCNQVWSFSCEYDFSFIFKYYPCETVRHMKWKNIYKSDTEHSQTLIDLINEIDLIKMEVRSLNNRKDLKRDVESALMDLRKLQIISDDAIELLRLIDPLESTCTLTMTMPVCNEVIPDRSDKVRPCKDNSDSRNKIIPISQNKLSSRGRSCLKSDTSNSVSNRKELISISKKYPELLLEKSSKFNAKTVITGTPTFTRNQKENFTLKKRSEISIRFEQDRKHKK